MEPSTIRYETFYTEGLETEVKEANDFLQNLIFSSKMTKNSQMQSLLNQINGSIQRINNSSISDWGARVSALSQQSPPLSSNHQPQKMIFCKADETESRITNRTLSFDRPTPPSKPLVEEIGDAVKDAFTFYGMTKIPLPAELKRSAFVACKNMEEGPADLIAKTVALSVVIRTLSQYLKPTQLILVFTGARIVKALTEEGRNALPKDLNRSMSPKFGAMTGRQADVLLQIAALPSDVMTGMMKNLEILAKSQLTNMGITNERISKIAKAFAKAVRYNAEMVCKEELEAHLRMLEGMSDQMYKKED